MSIIPQNEKAKVASAASDGNTFMILWTMARALHDVSDGAIMQQLMLDGLDVQGDEATTGKRRKKSDTMSNLASAHLYVFRKIVAIGNSRRKTR